MSEEIELIYFNLQGRATLIRMLLRMSGCEWKDTRIPANKEAWVEKKPKLMEDALGSVPVLKLNGQVFCQTDAIIDWAAAKAGLYSSDPVRRMKVILRSLLCHIYVFFILGENDCRNHQRSNDEVSLSRQGNCYRKARKPDGTRFEESFEAYFLRTLQDLSDEEKGIKL